MLSKSILKRGLASVEATTPIIKPIRTELKPLPYEMGALEPVISGHQMDFHYGKHHRTYVKNLNMMMEKAAEA